jgi:hypothetical protein
MLTPRDHAQVLLLLILSFWVSYYLKVRRIRSIHETIVALFSGMLVGALVRLAPGHVVQDMIAFKSTILLNVLLPPIILNSGYQLKQEHFFRHFHVILTFAFAGTFISAVALGSVAGRLCAVLVISTNLLTTPPRGQRDRVPVLAPRPRRPLAHHRRVPPVRFDPVSHRPRHDPRHL